MTRITALFLFVSAIALLSSADAFSMQPARSVEGLTTSRASSKRLLASILKMSEEGSGESPPAQPAETKVSADGTFYDDEMDSAPIKTGISDSMRQRLMAEASTGLDSNQSQTNVILYICVGVAVLVALGGSGILY